MNRSTIRLWPVLVLVSVVAVLAVSPGYAPAQTPPPANPTPAPPAPPVPPAAPAPSNTPPAKPLPTVQGNDLIIFSIVSAAFAIAVLLILFIYMYKIQARFYSVVERSSPAGGSFHTTWVATFPGGGTATAAAAPTTLTIKGPASVTVGEASAEYELEGVASGGASAEWSIEPSNAAAVVPDRGTKVKVIPVTPGVFKLVAKFGTQTVTAQVAASAAQPARTDLPFVGGGYGAVLVVVVLLVVVPTLGIAGVLTSEAIGTLFGGLLGYVFGVTTRTSRPTDKATDQGGQS